MLRGNLKALKLEVDAAIAFRDEHLGDLQSLVERYHGPAFRKGRGAVDDPENWIYEYVSLVLPRTVHDYPRFRVESARPIVQERAAKAFGIAMNRLAKVTRLRQTLRSAAIDALLGWSVVMVLPHPPAVAADAAKRRLPFAKRISPARFFMDASADDADDCRFMGHSYEMDADDLLYRAQTEEGWDEAAIHELIESGGAVDATERDKQKGAEQPRPERLQVTVYEVFMAEGGTDEELDPDLDARRAEDALERRRRRPTVYTYGVCEPKPGDRRQQWLRKPMAFKGPPEGPYVVLGIYAVPDDPYPLSPVRAIRSQIDDSSRVQAALREQSRRYRRLLLIDGKSRKLAQALKKDPNETIVQIDDFASDRVLGVEVGGITPQNVEYLRIAQERLDRASGINDALRGNVTGDATATEISVAESGATLRIAYIKREFSEGVNEVCRRIAWYLWHDEHLEFALGEEAKALLGQADAVWSKKSRAGDFEDLEIEVEAYSMERSSEMLLQRRSMELVNAVAQLIAIKTNRPDVDIAPLATFIGNALNFRQIDVVLASMAGGGQSFPTGDAVSSFPAGDGSRGGEPTNALGEPSPIPARSRGGILGNAARRQ